MPPNWHPTRTRSIRESGADSISRVSGNFISKVQEFFDLRQNATSKRPTTALDWSNLLYMICLLLLAIVVLCGTIIILGILCRRIWKYGVRIRRKTAMRNLGVPRRFSHDLIARRFHSASRIFELPSPRGSIPQIRISASFDKLAPNRAISAMSNSSAMPHWAESRSSIATTISHAPGSPNSFSGVCPSFGSDSGRVGISSSAVPSSSVSIHNFGSFWKRVSKRQIRFTQQQQVERQRLLGQVQQQFLLDVEVPYQGIEFATSIPMSRSNLGSAVGHISENGSSHNEEDRDIDERSVAHYELSFHNGEKTTGCFRGTLTYQLRYDFIHRVLMLHVIRANRLPTSEGCPDPYIKMYCLPERRNHCKTSIFKKSGDPEFNEMFSFDVAYNQLPNRMLQFTVYDFDRFTRHGLIGNVIMRDIFEKSDLQNWTEYTMHIVGSQEKNDFGDLLLYLAYSLQLRKLYVTVSKAYNLRPMDITGASDPYVKVELIYQRRRVKMRKTSIKRANLNPVYHECLEFDLSPSQVNETNLLVEVMDWDRIGRDDLLGCCVVGRESPTKEGRQQWAQCFSNIKLSSDSSPLMPHSSSVGAEPNGCLEDSKNCTIGQESKFLLGGYNPKMSVSQYADDGAMETEEIMSDNGITNRSLCLSPVKMAQSAPTTAKNSAISGVSGNVETDGVPRAVGVWHSILGEVPEGFRNIPKAKKK